MVCVWSCVVCVCGRVCGRVWVACVGVWRVCVCVGCESQNGYTVIKILKVFFTYIHTYQTQDQEHTSEPLGMPA